MKNNFIFLLIGLLLCLMHNAEAQDPEVTVIEEYASPNVRGMGKGRGIVVGYERAPQFDIESESDDDRVGNGAGRVSRNNRFYARALAPIINRPQTKVIFGFDYELEEFNFENVVPSSYSLYKSLAGRNLQSVGTQAIYLHSVDACNFYLLRLNVELNGDYRAKDINFSDYLKTTLDFGYGWKKSPDFVLGVGFQVGYTYGRKSILPAIIYNRTFNDNWGIESIFPANLQIRYNLNEKTFLYGGYRLDGASYNLFIKEPPLSEFNPLELRRTDIKGLVRLEREIYDFLWFGVEGGFRQYIRNRVFDEVGSRDVLIHNDLAGAGYIAVELFAVAPRKWLERSRSR